MIVLGSFRCNKIAHLKSTGQYIRQKVFGFDFRLQNWVDNLWEDCHSIKMGVMSADQ